MFHSLKTIGFLAIYVFSLTSANAPELLYKAKGDDVVLDPHFSGSPINSIQWKHGTNIAAEWYGGDPECFLQFKGRCTLDYSTGALTITGLYRNESGIFKVEINDKHIDMEISLSVISKVLKPTISSQCDTDTTSCNLTCDGDTTDAEPASYTWFGVDAEKGSEKVLEITKETTDESFTCMLKNPVSHQTSDSFPNPIITKDKGNLAAIIVPIVLILPLIGLIAFVVYKKRNGQSLDFNRLRRRSKRGTKEENAVIHVNGIGNVLQQPNATLDVVSEVQEESNQGSASAVTQNNVGESDSEAQSGPIQVQAHVEPQNASNSSEREPLLAETSNQDPESAASPGTSEDTGNTSGKGKTPIPDLTLPESLNTNEETEKTALTSNNHESANHENHELTNHEPTVDDEEAGGEGDGD